MDRKGGPPATAYSMIYTYDLMGNMVTLSYPSSSGTRRLVEYTYNANGESDRLRDITGTAFDYVKPGTSYGPLGTLTQAEFGNSVRTTLGVNKRAQLTSILAQKVGSTTHLSLAYSYFDNGQIQQIANSLDSLKTEKYTYDELHRLLSAQRGPDNNIQRKYEYDYDRWGNRWGQNLVAGSGGFNTQHSFSSSTNRVTTTGYTHDSSGNIDLAPGPVGYGYDMENFVSAAGTNVTYRMDARGRRVRKTVSGTATDFFYAGAQIIAEKTGSSWTDYIYFGGVIAKQTGSSASTATYLHADHLGSVRRCTDSSGNSAGSCDYEPFGENQPGSTCSLPTNFRFAGMYFDSETGLYHTWFRQYDAALARWMGVDRVDGGNRYMGVANDPVNLLDPLGLAECSFNVQLFNKAGLSDSQVALVQAQINKLLSSVASPNADSVGINFSFTGKADARLTIYRDASLLVNSLYDRPMGLTAFGSSRVYLNNLGIQGLPAGFVAQKVGSAGLHELAHNLLGVGDLEYDAANQNTLMLGKAPPLLQGEAGTNPNHPLWKLSPKQIADLFKRCSKSHPQQIDSDQSSGTDSLFVDPLVDYFPDIREGLRCIYNPERPGWCHPVFRYSFSGGWWPPFDIM